MKFLVTHYQETISDYLNLKILVFQFDNVHKNCEHCYGNKNTDQADLMLSFTPESTVNLSHLWGKNRN